MDALFIALRWTHIAAGMIALFVAPGAMLTVKGGRAHRRWGKMYFWMMAVVAATAVLLAARLPNVFLLLIAIFSFYQAFAGYRAFWRKRPRAGERATAADWAAAVLTWAMSAVLVVLGFVKPSPVFSRLGTVAIVFGLLGMVLAGRDLWRFLWPPANRHTWWFEHMTGMLGSYIATVTAFSVVNFTLLPPLVRWLWPTVVGVPAIVAWVLYYRIRFARTSSAPPDAPAVGVRAL
jgi:hypothetical protein